MKKKNNKYKYLRARVEDYISGFFLSFIYLFAPREKRRIIINSSFNSSFNHNSKYLFLYHLQKQKDVDYDIKFVINNDKKRASLIANYGAHFISNKGIKNKCFILGAASWVTSTLETPVGGVLLKTRRNVLHLGHGMPYKNIVYLEKKLSIAKKVFFWLMKSNFSYFLSTTDFYRPIIKEVFRCKDSQVVTLPQPRSDAVMGRLEWLMNEEREKFIESTIQFNKESVNLLYAPSWRQYGDTQFFPFEKPIEEIDKDLIARNTTIWLRPHPFFDTATINFNNLSNIRLIDNSICEDINEYLSLFDGLISDYSSIMLDFMELGRPIIKLDYDREVFNLHVGLVPGHDDLVPSQSCQNYDQFIEEVEEVTALSSLTKFQNKNHLANYRLNPNELACEIIWQFIFNNTNERF